MRASGVQRTALVRTTKRHLERMCIGSQRGTSSGAKDNEAWYGWCFEKECERLSCSVLLKEADRVLCHVSRPQQDGCIVHPLYHRKVTASSNKLSTQETSCNCCELTCKVRSKVALEARNIVDPPNLGGRSLEAQTSDFNCRLAGNAVLGILAVRVLEPLTGHRASGGKGESNSENDSLDLHRVVFVENGLR